MSLLLLTELHADLGEHGSDRPKLSEDLRGEIGDVSSTAGQRDDLLMSDVVGLSGAVRIDWGWLHQLECPDLRPGAFGEELDRAFTAHDFGTV
jgi:hypothetical protein